jgi:uncharacterized protein TP_0976
MTDLLLSQLLVLLILLPVLLRPFSKNLQKGTAIPILPFISLFVCICTIIGQDIVLFSALLLLFVVIVCLSEIIRLIAFFQGVLNDFYGIASIIFRIVLLLLFCGMVYAAFRFAPEAHTKTEHQLVVRSIDLTDTPQRLQQKLQFFEGRLIERQGGADKKALVIVTETYPDSGYPGTIAALLADQGYTVAELYTTPHRIISRMDLYVRLFRIIGKKDARYLAKETEPHISSAFSDSIETILNRYGSNKRLFLYTEGIYTALAEHFCAAHQGAFTGVFFNLSAEEPLPAIPEERMQTAYTDADDGAINSAAYSPAGTDTTTSGAVSSTAAGSESGSTAEQYTDAVSTQNTQGALGAAAKPNPAADTNPAAAAPGLPFYCRICPYRLLTGFGSLRADDVLAAELLGSGRSIGRKDKAAAAAAFQRYVLSL